MRRNEVAIQDPIFILRQANIRIESDPTKLAEHRPTLIMKCFGMLHKEASSLSWIARKLLSSFLNTQSMANKLSP